MRDIVITAKMIRRELYVLSGCFISAFFINVGAIIAYDRSWLELVSQIGFVFFITAVLYSLMALVRIAVWLLVKLFKRK